MSKEFATITREAPVEVQLGEIQFEGYDKEKVITIFKELGFQSLLDKMGGSDEPEADEEFRRYRICNRRGNNRRHFY